MIPIKLAGTGSYLPEKILTNFDLEKKLQTTDEWIVRHTGIKERRVAAFEQSASDLALPAAQAAMLSAGVHDRDLDYIIMATVTPDTCCPSGANWLQGKLDAPQAISFDITAACSGFIFVLDTAIKYFQAKAAKTILIVASEVMSRVQDWSDRANCIFWGDGAGAAVLKAEEGAPQILDIYIGTDGSNGQKLLLPGGGSKTTPISYESVNKKLHTLKLIEPNISARIAVHYFTLAVKTILVRQSISISEIDYFIPHQVNIRLLQSLAKSLNVDFKKFVITIDKYANVSSASCAIALDEVIRAGYINPGSLVCAMVFGGGLTWGAALIKF